MNYLEPSMKYSEPTVNYFIIHYELLRTYYSSFSSHYEFFSIYYDVFHIHYWLFRIYNEWPTTICLVSTIEDLVSSIHFSVSTIKYSWPMDDSVFTTNDSASTTDFSEPRIMNYSKPTMNYFSMHYELSSKIQQVCCLTSTGRSAGLSGLWRTLASFWTTSMLLISCVWWWGPWCWAGETEKTNLSPQSQAMTVQRLSSQSSPVYTA